MMRDLARTSPLQVRRIFGLRCKAPSRFPFPLSLSLYKSWDAFKTKIAMHRMRQQRNLARFRRRHALPIAESVVDERASIIRRSSAPPLVPPRSFLSDLDQEDENMSKPRGTDDENEMEDARTCGHGLGSIRRNAETNGGFHNSLAKGPSKRFLQSK